MVPLDIVFCKKFSFPAAVAGTTIMSQGVASVPQGHPKQSHCPARESIKSTRRRGRERQPHSPSIFLAAFIIENNREKVFTLASASVLMRNILLSGISVQPQPDEASLFQPPAGTTYPTQSSGGFCCPARTAALAAQHEKFWKSL